MRWRQPLWALIGVTLLWLSVSALRWKLAEAGVNSLPKETHLNRAFTAREGISEARRIATLWEPDCVLQCIRLAFTGKQTSNAPDLWLDGRPTPPNGWMYRFFHRPTSRFLLLTLTPDGRCEAQLDSAVSYMNSRPLVDNFIDSPAAIRISEASFAREFRGDGPGFRLVAQLTTWPSTVGGPADPIPHRSNWQLHYVAAKSNPRVDLFLMLDAVTGEVLAVQSSDGNGMQLIRNGFEEGGVPVGISND